MLPKSWISSQLERATEIIDINDTNAKIKIKN